MMLYKKNVCANITKVNGLLMTSIGKVAFNIDGSTLHSTQNTLVQQSLPNISNLFAWALNKRTCRYEQLQLCYARWNFTS